MVCLRGVPAELNEAIPLKSINRNEQLAKGANRALAAEPDEAITRKNVGGEETTVSRS